MCAGTPPAYGLRGHATARPGPPPQHALADAERGAERVRAARAHHDAVRAEAARQAEADRPRLVRRARAAGLREPAWAASASTGWTLWRRPRWCATRRRSRRTWSPRGSGRGNGIAR